MGRRSRQDKYPDTEYFHYYNANPRNKITTDCVLRALATGLNEDYNTVAKELFELSLKTGYSMEDKHLYNKYLESKGWHKLKQPVKRDGTKYTGIEWCDELNNDGEHHNIICHIGSHHIVAIVFDNSYGYRVYDIWNSSNGKIGTYWMK